jgi:hypothetical protein
MITCCQGKQIYFMYFPWLSVEAALLIFNIVYVVVVVVVVNNFF